MIGPQPAELGVSYKFLIVAAAVDLSLITFFRIMMMRAAEETLATRPDDTAALGRWFGANVVTFVLCETIAWFGFAIRYLGGNLMQAGTFYAVAFLSLLAVAPRRP